MILSLEERLVRELKARITEDIQAAYDNFGQGRWVIRDDAAATGMAAVLIQSRIAGLAEALKHIDQVHDAMTGKVVEKKREKVA